MKSYKKFPAPLKRLEAIACDAELQEKPLQELKKLGELLKQRCKASIGDQTKENITDANDDSTGKLRNCYRIFNCLFFSEFSTEN